MPLFYQQNINETTRLGVWKIEEDESFFLRSVPLQRSITHPNKRLQHLAGRYLLPHLFPDFPSAAIEIADTRKPFLPDEQYHFSISHCGRYAAALVSSTQRVGIDIEMITPRVEKIKHKFLHPDELAFVHSQAIPQQVELLTLLWSAKEAMFKWWGNGEVDFSEVLRTNNFTFSAEGIIPAIFLKEPVKIDLKIHYQVREGVSLAWVVQ
ncbi:MAG: 4'-phosphopantetheinyl transferase superfamily protein [Sediminibacterium sp.]|nr:4'-phosphopantetheinyl transferase superfamily protein [Sediminibacterium sp.]